MRAAALAALLVGASASPAAVIAGARASEPAPAAKVEAPGRRMDWPLLAVAVAALVIGRTVAHRRRKSSDTPPR